MESENSRAGSCGSTVLDWPKPRALLISRAESGFGFTLRQFIIYPPPCILDASKDEDEDYLYRGYSQLSRGPIIEPQETIFVKSVKEGSPAYYAGLSIGDRIVAVNGDTVSNKSYQDIIAAIKQSDDYLKLLVVPKDEDILQMAYQSQTGSCMVSSSSTFPDFRLSGLNNCHHQHSRSSSDIVHKTTEQGRFYSNENLAFDRHEVRHSYPLSQWGVNEAELRLEDFSFDLQCHRAIPLRSDGNPALTRSNKQQSPGFQDQESIMASNAAYTIPGKSKYSFGLYFPPKPVNAMTGGRNDSGNHTTENIARGYEDSPQQSLIAKPHTFDMNQKSVAYRKKSLDDSSAFSSSARSRDLLIRYSADRTADENKNRYSPRHSVHERSSVENRPANSMSRSQTVTGISPSIGSNAEQSLKQLSDYHKSGSENSLHTNQSPQYIPVYSGNKLPSSEGNSRESSVDDSGGSSVYSEQSDPSSQPKTYMLRLPYEQQRHQQYKVTESSSTPVRQRYGTTFALSRAPTVMHIELQKSIGKPIVSQRKYQFESGRNENTHVPGISGFNRYKTEIEKIRTQPKFSSVALRKASFEQSPDRDPPGFDDPVELEKNLTTNYSGSNMETAQPTIKAKTNFVERYNTSSPHQFSENRDRSYSTREKYQENIPAKMCMPVGKTQCLSAGEGTTQTPQQDTEKSLSKSTLFQTSPDFHTPHHDNIDTSSGSVGVAGCDISTGSLADSGVWMRSYCGSSDMLDAVDAVSGVSDSGVFSLCGSSTDQEVSSIQSSRPARKASYLTAVNAPAQRIMSESDNASLSDHPDGQVSTEEMFPEGLNVVTMRKKLQESLEDQASKLHRRTSYLMATARDRTNKSSLEMTFSSPHVVTDHALLHTETPIQQFNSVKLNRFFGEVIPTIAEVVETRLSDHEDPLEVIRKGPLLCKISVIEGKKCSDRSWKPVYAILRPTELFLTRDRDSGFTSSNFEDQYIPLKLCMVEFARDYAKKKKNVFRMSTYNECEYLFQAEDRGTLMCWIQGIKSINEPMKADRMEDVMTSEREKQMHSPVEIYAGLSSKMSPQLGHKGRKLSALSFKSKLASSPNMKRKKSNAADKEEVIKKGWMDRIPMMKSLKKHSEDTSGLSLAEQDMETNKFQFGVPLECCFPSPHNEFVPLIVELCTRIVEARGLECVGVYRVPGNSAAVNALTEEFNRGIDSVNIDNEKLLDINVISSLVKSFFRKLPEPLIPADLYEDFIEANRCPDESKRKLRLKRLLHLLPSYHNETFKHMAEHLNKVASYGNINKMDAKNLAIMFGPTLVRKKGDDTVSLVTDMSDQCRIVESIILHHEWFFGPWDQDSYIPMETTVETVPVDDGQSQSKDDDEEADSAISTKEIISSIVGAASKKLRQKQQNKSLESVDTVDSCSIASISTYKDRSRDDSFNMTSLTQSMASITSSLSDSEENPALRLLVPSYPYLQLCRSDPVNKGDFKKSEHAVSYQMSPSFSRQQPGDFLADKHDELKISHEPAVLSQDAISRLKRIGDDVSALLHTFEQKQLKEREHRKREKEMVEREHLRTQLELEQEENHSVEDWLEWKGSLATTRMPDLVSSSYIGDKFSYDQNQSSLVAISQEKREQQNQRKVPLGVQQDSAHPSQSLTNLANYSPYKAVLTQPHATPSNQSRMSRGGSHEDILSQCRNVGHDAVRPVVMRGPCQRRLQENQQKAMHLTVGGAVSHPASIRNSFGRRHGSLDSLIDMIDKQEKRSSWASSDSEDGSDLLTSITTTFDQKLQILLNPKYKLTGAGKRYSRIEATGSTSEGILDWQNEIYQTKTPANTKQVYTVNTFLDSSRSYRDPSLHRSARSDPKIGIASRFERNDITRTTSSSPVSSSSNTVTNLGNWSKRQLPDFKSFLGKSTSHSKDGNSVILTKPKKLESRVVKTRNVGDQREPGLVLKSSKGGTIQNLCPLKEEPKFFLGDNPSASRDKFQEETTETGNLRTRHRYRRHTVGGLEDIAHINAISQVCSDYDLQSYPTSRYRLSAWDQLQPAVNAPGSRNMQAWIQRERLRGSTPDLSVLEM